MKAGPVLIGLTGPIGCGKSTVAGWLASMGGRRIDMDALAREVTAPGTATLPAIRRRFGDGVFAADGSLDRAALAGIVFRDSAALADLERIVHPFVRERLVEEVASAGAAGVPFVVIEAIKLVELGIAAACDAVWVVDCGPEMQRARLSGAGGGARRRGTADGRPGCQPGRPAGGPRHVGMAVGAGAAPRHGRAGGPGPGSGQGRTRGGAGGPGQVRAQPE